MKKILTMGLATFLFLGGASLTKAVEGDDALPSADDPFWTIMSELNRPDDPTCQAKTEDLLNSLGLPGGAERAAATCAGVARILEMEDDMAADGTTSNLFDEEDWHHVDNLYFQSADEGRIEFTKEIDFMSRDFMLFVQTLGERLDMAQDEIALDADIVESLRTAGAILTMYNVSEFDDPEILVDDSEDAEGVVSGLTYNKDNNTIVFNAAHFTTFKAVEKGSSTSSKKPKITEVEYKRYVDEDGKVKLKVEINGKNFKKSCQIKLGHQTISRVTWKNSQRIEARFTLKKILKGKHKNPVTLKVLNPNGKTKKFHEKIDVTKNYLELH